MANPPFGIESDDGVWIGDDLYLRSPDGLRFGLHELRTFGYLVEGTRYSDERLKNVPLAQYEAGVRPLWYAKLPGIDLVQCRNCLGILTTQCINEDTRVCEYCGANTTHTIVGGGRFPNHDQVKFWRGQVYDPYPYGGNPLPIPELVNVYEAWRWAPLTDARAIRDELIRVGNLRRDPGDYYEGERLNDAMGGAERIKRIELFVEHFTTLNADQWRSAIQHLGTWPLAATMWDAVDNFCTGI